MANKRLLIIMISAATLLSIPFFAMQLTTEINWKLSDFIIMGILLFGTGLLCELVMRRVKSIRNRILICIAILFMFCLFWAELAVGLIGTPFSSIPKLNMPVPASVRFRSTKLTTFHKFNDQLYIVTPTRGLIF